MMVTQGGGAFAGTAGTAQQRIGETKRTLIHACVALLFVLGMGCGCSFHRPTGTYAPGGQRVILEEGLGDKKLAPYVVNGVRYYPLPDATGYVETGKASWYGGKFHGRKTANGEVYDMYGPTAAHKTLPLGTYVSVENLASGRTTVVRINDRGPFVEGRIIDLSYAAAREIEMVGPGVVDVKITALARQVETRRGPGGVSRVVVETPDLNKGTFTVQVGAFANKANALDLASRLRVIYDFVNIQAHVDDSGRTLHRVRVSMSTSLGEAREKEKELREMGFIEAFVVRI